MIFSGSRYRIPDIYVWLVSGLCVFPLLLNFVGVDFGNVVETLSPVKVLEMTQIEEQPGYRDLLTGRYVHTILASISIAFAIVTLVLALIDYTIRKEAGIDAKDAARAQPARAPSGTGLSGTASAGRIASP